jgi:hypothetical protein
MHIVATIMQLVLMLAPLGFAAAAFHGWLHVHSIASLITSIVAGVVSFMAVPYEPTLMLGHRRAHQHRCPPALGAVLAVALWRTPSARPEAQRPQR